MAELVAELAKKIGNTGGTISGELVIRDSKGLNISTWGSISAGTDGHVLMGQNCYKHPTKNTYHFKNTHENIGAKGIVFMLGMEGVYIFDTGSRATTADEEFTPKIHRVMTEKGGNFGGHVHIYGNGSENLALVGADHVFMQFFRDGVTNGRSGYIGYPGAAAPNLEIANLVPNGYISINAPDGLHIRGHKIPRTIRSTSAPNSVDGEDGDVWHQYV